MLGLVGWACTPGKQQRQAATSTKILGETNLPTWVMSPHGGFLGPRIIALGGPPPSLRIARMGPNWAGLAMAQNGPKMAHNDSKRYPTTPRTKLEGSWQHAGCLFVLCSMFFTRIWRWPKLALFVPRFGHMASETENWKDLGPNIPNGVSAGMCTLCHPHTSFEPLRMAEAHT